MRPVWRQPEHRRVPRRRLDDREYCLPEPSFQGASFASVASMTPRQLAFGRRALTASTSSATIDAGAPPSPSDGAVRYRAPRAATATTLGEFSRVAPLRPRALRLTLERRRTSATTSRRRAQVRPPRHSRWWTAELALHPLAATQLVAVMRLGRDRRASQSDREPVCVHPPDLGIPGPSAVFPSTPWLSVAFRHDQCSKARIAGPVALRRELVKYVPHLIPKVDAGHANRLPQFLIRQYGPAHRSHDQRRSGLGYQRLA